MKRGVVRHCLQYQTGNTYAGTKLTAGEAPLWLAAQNGHSNTTMGFRDYGRWIPEVVPESGNEAVEMLAAGARKKAAIKLR